MLRKSLWVFSQVKMQLLETLPGHTPAAPGAQPPVAPGQGARDPSAPEPASPLLGIGLSSCKAGLPPVPLSRGSLSLLLTEHRDRHPE